MSLLVRLCKELGFYLAQEFYHYNPARLPAPAEWVNIRRIRVKDSVNIVWWLSKTPFPKADNRRVLKAYSASMESLLKNGYKAKLRPSGHDISDKFSTDNNGAIPPNVIEDAEFGSPIDLLEIANTESNSQYLRLCKERGLKPHPARFPRGFADFFIKFLTDEEDIVLDPFAGSNTTGYVAESLNRKWIAFELNKEYLESSMLRFEGIENLFVQNNAHHTKAPLFERVINSIIASGWNILYLPSESSNFLRLQIYKGEESYRLRIYIWNLTHGGGQFRPTDEMRIQVTGVDHFENVPPELTLILGWWAEQDVFAAFDFAKHSQAIGWSASIQIRKKALEEAHKNGFGIWTKETEIVVAVKPEYFIEYIRNHNDIHAFGNIPESPRALEQALQDENISEEEVAITPKDRKEILITLRKRSRDISFRSRVLNAYSNSCAMCNVQARG